MAPHDLSLCLYSETMFRLHRWPCKLSLNDQLQRRPSGYGLSTPLKSNPGLQFVGWFAFQFIKKQTDIFEAAHEKLIYRFSFKPA